MPKKRLQKVNALGSAMVLSLLAGCSDDTSLNPVRPCDPNPCVEVHRKQCTPDAENFPVCSCDSGFRDFGDGLCKPNNPCQPNPCTEVAKTQCVVNSLGDVRCACDPDHQPTPAPDGQCIRKEYQCSDVNCGADAWVRDCQANQCGSWTVNKACESGQVCWSNSTGSGCSECALGCHIGKCSGCDSGACCEKGGLKGSEAVCAGNCGTLIEGCYALGGSGCQSPSISAATAEECRKFCNSVSGTACCDWLGGTKLCYAIPCQGCKVPTGYFPPVLSAGMYCGDPVADPMAKDVFSIACQ